MKKLFLFAAMAATVLASCAKNEVFQKETAKTPVSFGVYTQRSVETKVGGEAGDQTIITLGHKDKSGFGVYCFYSDNTTYVTTPSNNFVPNFMWNQQVKGNGDGANPTAWSYSPVKYWPNEYVNTVTDEGIDRLTFFAYAPWVDATKDTGNVGSETEGITHISDYNDDGDPTLTYVIPASSANHVDVLYADKTNLVNLVKPAGNANVVFNFKHALTKVTFRVQTFIDGTNNTALLDDEGAAVDGQTTVTLTDLNFGGASIYPSGTLNIATGAWTPADAGTKTFTHTGLTQNVTKTKAAVTGVPTITLIPNGSSATYNVNVIYTVETIDANLNGGKSTVTNNIKNTITLTLAPGKNNIIDLVLGLYTVKVSATVTDWEDAAVEVDLPANN